MVHMRDASDGEDEKRNIGKSTINISCGCPYDAS